MRSLLAVIAALVVVAGCGENGSDAPSAAPSPSVASAVPSTFNVSGTFTLVDHSGIYADGGYTGAPCAGADGYDDVQQGAQVIVRDGEDRKVALGELGPGVTTGRYYRDFRAACEFPLMVFGVPDSGGIYSIEVSHRGDISFTRADAEEGLTLSLG